MAGSESRTVGKAAEDRALQFLRDRGFRCLERNFRSRFGEIDLIMLDENCLVFVEVRSRGASSFAAAAATVDGKKQSRLWSTALFYLAKHPAASNYNCRFDVIGVNKGTISEWYQDAFRCD